MILNVARQLMSYSWDYFFTAKPDDILTGSKNFRPFRRYQQKWLERFYPEDWVTSDKHVWFYLQKYMLPLIMQYASSYHIEGIIKLGLDKPRKPNFIAFQKTFADHANGFEIEAVEDEIHPVEYFTLIRAKKFPCVAKLRSHHELFCAGEPDFWHEAIGHLAPLCFQEVQQFYLEVADYVLSAKSKQQFDEHLAVAWTLMEYGFLQQNGIDKMFGAALVGSHLANMRYRHGVIQVEPASFSAIIGSGFYAEASPLPRTVDGKLRFFGMERLSAQSYFQDSCGGGFSI